MIDWIELIPFNETRNYVQRVIENVVMRWYRAAPARRPAAAPARPAMGGERHMIDDDMRAAPPALLETSARMADAGDGGKLHRRPDRRRR